MFDFFCNMIIGMAAMVGRKWHKTLQNYRVTYFRNRKGQRCAGPAQHLKPWSSHLSNREGSSSRAFNHNLIYPWNNLAERTNKGIVKAIGETRPTTYNPQRRDPSQSDIGFETYAVILPLIQPTVPGPATILLISCERKADKPNGQISHPCRQVTFW